MNPKILDTLETFSKDINNIFNKNLKSLYVYGSAIYDDLHVGYSDLDFFAVVSNQINEDDFYSLKDYRHRIKKSSSPYFSMLEGEFISFINLKNTFKGNTICWGGSGEKLDDKYQLSGFSLKGLIDNGFLVFGEDIRKQFSYPNDEIFLSQIDNLIKTIRKYAVEPSEDIHSIDWLFLICQSIYWIETKNITCKTKATQ
ncbi:hypothetical protein [Clostridium cellulovorans]|uniref:DNA polymerase beta domain protein region n=1 Tax=Clostridium cellulovorans (strain ATCC 35296 / DSM 3052 / OCM 3 / 743B) TaxID=573061 RepID=D9STG9_CLOC7|nr:hypothetical protein [Clostridium cellulovorans]ADL52703.1 DNA polymerase beta domain protein region [Clostridium cellulovorans 743B]